jgi:queuine tRNA-ribosyltransferase
VAACAALGYSLCDSALPTRDARAGRLYTCEPGERMRTLYIDDAKHTRSKLPIAPGCDCRTCLESSVGFLHHLRACGDPLFQRLATIHNLRYMTRLMERLRAGGG